MGMKVWGCIYCLKAGTKFTVPRSLQGYNDLSRHYAHEHPGRVTRGKITLTPETVEQVTSQKYGAT